MRVKLGSIVSEASGKVGGFVASQSAGTAYLKAQPSVKNNPTARQRRVRNRTYEISQAWKNLSSEARKQWIQFAEVFKSSFQNSSAVEPNAFDVYSRVQHNSLFLTGIIRPLPVIRFIKLRAQITSLVIDSSGSGSILVGFVANQGPGFRFEFRATRGLSPGINYSRNDFVSLGPFFTGGSNPRQIVNEYTNIFGALKPGSKVYIQMRVIDTQSLISSKFEQASAIVQ